ncbi:MAG: HEAT repeat domain-containing protein [Verrucomicrobia bacterium]|nr:HEAT repeat domain-containing protein [Verrucomicrobiota bacterium]
MRLRYPLRVACLAALVLAASCGRRDTGRTAAPDGTGGVNFALGLQELDPGNKLLGNLRAVVVLVDFSDAPVDRELYPPERLRAFMFDREAKGLGHYVAENSGGRYTIDGEVFGWYRSRWSVTDLNATPGGERSRLQRLAEECVRRTLKEGVDPAAFDNDGPDGVPRSEDSTDDDGLVDELYVFFAGPLDTGYGLMGRYANFARRTTFLSLTTGECGFGVTGYYLHEAGHFIYHAYDHYGSHFQGEYGIGIWGMMGLGCWGQRGDIARDEIWTQPSHFTAYHKIAMGWLEPRLITESTRNVRLTAMAIEPQCVEIPIPGTLEYFLVENRQPIGFEDRLPGGGLLIYHCNRTWKGNFTLLQADGRADLQHGHPVGRPYPPTTENLGDDGDPFPGSTGNTHFGPKTTPSSLSEMGLESGITIRGISRPGDVMSFDVHVDRQVHEGLERITTIAGCLDELQTNHPVRRRNAALSLVEIAPLAVRPNERVVPALTAALSDADRLVKLYAARALGRLEAGGAVSALANLAAHGDPEVAAEAIIALGVMAPGLVGGQRIEALASMAAGLESGSRDVRTAALKALATLGDAGFEKAFLDALSDKAPPVQRAAAEALGRMKSRNAVGPLLVAARDELRDEAARVAAIEALGHIGHEPAAIGLHSLLHAPQSAVRRAAVEALGEFRSKDSIGALVAALSHDGINAGNARHADTREAVAAALTAIGPDAVPPLISLVEGSEAPLDAKLLAAGALAELGDPAAIDPIVRLALALSPSHDDDAAARDEKRRVRNGLAHQARRLASSRPTASSSVELLVDLGSVWLGDEDPRRRVEGAELLMHAASSPAPAVLLGALADQHPDVREAAARALGELGDPRALPGLTEQLDDEYSTVRDAAAATLGMLHDGRAVDALAKRLEHETDRRVTIGLVKALAEIGTIETVGPLIAVLDGPVYAARVAAARGLNRHNTPEAVDALIAALPDPGFGVIIKQRWADRWTPRLRVWAMRSLMTLGDPRAAAPIRAYLESDDLSSRLPAAVALTVLGGVRLNGMKWPEAAPLVAEYIETTTGRELLEFVPREYLRD